MTGRMQRCRACGLVSRNGAAHSCVVVLQRAYDKAREAERRAIEAVPETPPRHQPTARARHLAELAWAAAERTNAARAALTTAIDSAAASEAGS